MGRVKENMMLNEEEVAEELEGIPDGELVGAVLSWASEQDNFDSSFLESLEDWLEENDELTENQRKSVVKIVHKFNIDVEEYLD